MCVVGEMEEMAQKMGTKMLLLHLRNMEKENPKMYLRKCTRNHPETGAVAQW
jgi:hypothetical protein